MNQIIDKLDEDENEYNDIEQNEEHKEIIPNNDQFNVPLIDTNNTNPTLVLLPFCIQLYPLKYFKELQLRSRRSSKTLSMPPPKPPIIENIENENENDKSQRKKSLSDVLPEPHKPSDIIQRDTSSPTPPL